MRPATRCGALKSGRCWLLLWCLAICCAGGLSACAIGVGQPQIVGAKDAINVPIELQRLSDGGVNILIDIKIDGQGPFTFKVDTGAEYSLIDTTIASDLNLQPVGGSEHISGVGGSEPAVPVSISTWSMGVVRLPSSTVEAAAVHDNFGGNTVGLLGSDVLSQFGNITINYDLKMLTVYKQIA